MRNHIPDYHAACAKIDAALKPDSEDLAKVRIVGAHMDPGSQDIIAARSIWAAAREGLAKAFAASRIDVIADRRDIDPDTIDYTRSTESIWALPYDTAMILAEDLQEGLSGRYLWDPILKT